MEPSHSQIFAGAEECHSCESGWTMYLGSPVDDDDDDGHSDDDEEEDEEEDNKAYDPEDESDDSMASDASSGPSHHYGYQWGNSEGGQVEEEAVETQEKDIEEKKVKKKEMALMDNKGEVQDEKVRENHWMGKRK